MNPRVFGDFAAGILRKNPGVRPLLQPFLDDPSLLRGLSRDAAAALSRGDMSAFAEAVRLQGKGRAINYSIPQGPSGPGTLVPQEPMTGELIPAGPRGLSVPGPQLSRGQLSVIDNPGQGVPVGGAAGGPRGLAPTPPPGPMQSRALNATLAAAAVGEVSRRFGEMATSDLSDGLAGAPQDDITPEPVAGEAPPSPQAEQLPPSRQARPSDTPLAPPEVMTQADIDYVNSLPQNSPEAMLRKAKRWDESDRRMEGLEYRLRERLGTDISEAELASLQAGGVPPSFDPGSLGRDERLPSVSSARPQSYSNPNTFDPMAQADPRQAFRDFERAQDNRLRNMGYPVEAMNERAAASGTYGTFEDRMRIQSEWAKAMQIDPEGRGIGPNAFQRRYNPKESREWYEQNVVSGIRERAQGELAAAEAKQQAERDTPLTSSQWNTGPDGATNLRDAKLERADLERRVKTYARQKGLKFADALEQLSADPNSPFNALKQSLPGDKYSALERASSQQHRMNYVKNPEAILAARNPEKAERMRRLSARNMLLGNDPRQNAANAFLALGDDSLTEEQRKFLSNRLQNISGSVANSQEMDLLKTQIMANAQVKSAEAQGSAKRAEVDQAYEERQALRGQAEQEKREREAINLAGPGAAALIRREYGTEAAQEALKKLARDSDKSWMGYYQEDADRLDEALKSYPFNIDDPEVRRRLVEQYGFGLKDGRGTLTSAAARAVGSNF